MLVVSVKYIVFILRADNRGEGGVLALLALVLQRQHRRRRGCATPGAAHRARPVRRRCSTATASSRRRSRCSARSKGLEVATPALAAVRRADHARDLCRAVHGAAVRHGAGRPAFGPITLVWFVTIGVLGLDGDRASSPAILRR